MQFDLQSILSLFRLLSVPCRFRELLRIHLKRRPDKVGGGGGGGVFEGALSASFDTNLAGGNTFLVTFEGSVCTCDVTAHTLDAARRIVHIQFWGTPCTSYNGLYCRAIWTKFEVRLTPIDKAKTEVSRTWEDEIFKTDWWTTYWATSGKTRTHNIFPWL